MDTENLPPTRKGREYEIRAIGLREFAGLRRDDERLNPFDLAKYAKLLVASFEQIEPFLRKFFILTIPANWRNFLMLMVLTFMRFQTKPKK